MTRNTTGMARSFGVGPFVAGPALLWLAVSWAATLRLPAVTDGFPSVVGRWIGAALVGTGVVMYLVGFRQFSRALRGELVTTGLFGWCRHPFYAIWIFLLIPGIACLVGNWMGLAAPFIAVALFLCLIRREESEIESRFGQAYRDYADRVGRLWPGRRNEQ